MTTKVDWPLLQSAPINEAIIDLRVQLVPEFDLKRLLDLHVQLKDTYPTVEETGSWATGEGKNSRATDAVSPMTGYLFRSSDQKQVVQFRLDGFTFSRLRPYENWQSLKAEAHRLWNIYFEMTKPANVLRISTRYVNQLGIPKNIEKLNEQLKAPPVLPPGMGLNMQGFFQATFLSDSATALSALVTQMIEPVQKDPAEDRLLLDIDVFRDGKFDPDERVWQTLDDCREVKNRIFFGTLTEKLVARYK